MDHNLLTLYENYYCPFSFSAIKNRDEKREKTWVQKLAAYDDFSS